MEHKFRKSDNGIDLQALLDFCKKEGKMVEYRKGEQLEREDDLARLFDLVLLCGHVVTTVTVTTFVEFRERKLILSRANTNTRREKVYCSQGERSVFPIVFLYLNSYLPTSV